MAWLPVRNLVRRILPVTPFFLGMIFGVKTGSDLARFHMLVASLLLVALALLRVPFVYKASTFLKELHLGKKDVVAGAITVGSFLLSILAIGIMRLHTTPPAFTVVVLWWIVSLVWRFRGQRAASAVDYGLVLTANALLGILGFLFVGLPVSLPLILIPVGYSCTLSAAMFFGQLSSVSKPVYFRRAVAILLALGPCTIMAVSSLGFLSKSYISVVFLIFLIMPILEQLCNPDAELNETWKRQVEVYVVLFLGSLLLFELFITMEAVSEYLEAARQSSRSR